MPWTWVAVVRTSTSECSLPLNGCDNVHDHAEGGKAQGSMQCRSQLISQGSWHKRIRTLESNSGQTTIIIIRHLASLSERGSKACP